MQLVSTDSTSRIDFQILMANLLRVGLGLRLKTLRVVFVGTRGSGSRFRVSVSADPRRTPGWRRADENCTNRAPNRKLPASLLWWDGADCFLSHRRTRAAGA